MYYLVNQYKGDNSDILWGILLLIVASMNIILGIAMITLREFPVTIWQICYGYSALIIGIIWTLIFIWIWLTAFFGLLGAVLN
jgi:hypothetical protein